VKQLQLSQDLKTAQMLYFDQLKMKIIRSQATKTLILVTGLQNKRK
jgi:hypothetical protein